MVENQSYKAAGPRKIIIAVTGASAMIYLRQFLKIIAGSQKKVAVHGICSASGKKVLFQEMKLTPAELPGVTKWFDVNDIGAEPASGSSGYDSMVVLPCTMVTLAAIAGGLSTNLIHRAADVILQESKTLLLGVRETPFSRTHLSNMLKAHDSGATIFPPMPSFYFNPQTLEEAATTYCWRLADHLGIEISERKRWEGK